MSGATSADLDGRAARTGLPAATELLLRPERFFEGLFSSPRWRLTALLVVLTGAADGEAWISLRMMLSDAGVLSGARDPGAAGWWRFWLALLVGGLVGGPISWVLWGGWFRLRLRLSGAKAPDSGRARTVWVWSEAVWALPTLGLLAASTLVAPDYATASRTGPFALSTIVLPLYSIFVGYRAAIGCFGAEIRRARFWFLALPAALFGVALVGAFAVVLRQTLAG